MRIDEENARIQEMLAKYETVVYTELVSRVTIAAAATAKKVELCAAATDKDYFTDSSFLSARKLQKGQSFMVKEILCRCPQAMPKADVVTIFDSATKLFVSEQVGSAIKRTFTLRSLGGGGGVSGHFTEAVASDDTLLNHGTPNRGSGLMLPEGDYIFWEEDTEFDCYLGSGAAVTPAADRILEFVFRGFLATNAKVANKG